MKIKITRQYGILQVYLDQHLNTSCFGSMYFKINTTRINNNQIRKNLSLNKKNAEIDLSHIFTVSSTFDVLILPESTNALTDDSFQFLSEYAPR